MYIQGVSTRKVSAIVEKLCGKKICSSKISRVVALLEETLESWHNRPLGVFPYVFLDSRYEKVRQIGQIRDAAILIGSGVDLQGKRKVLGVSVSLSEQEVHWRDFLEGLIACDLSAVELVAWELKAVRIADW